MCYPERSMQYHPRNKNMILGMLIEAIYYSQVVTGESNTQLLAALRDVVEHCTACGRCMANCPVKIPSGEVALSLRAFLDHEGAGGHPIKERVLEYLKEDIAKRVPKAAKMASIGQKMQNRILSFLPQAWKKRFESPMFSGRGPKMGYTNLYESLKLSRGNIFLPHSFSENMPLALYFPGCGGALFYDRIGISSLMLLLSAGYAVAIPPKHLCCGYPLLAAGMDTAYEDTLAECRQQISEMLRKISRRKFAIKLLVTSCGTCLDSLSRLHLSDSFPGLAQSDVVQAVLPLLDRQLFTLPESPKPMLYHGACHCEWEGLHRVKGQAQIVNQLSQSTGYEVRLHPGCCGESGMGSITSPAIYNQLRKRKEQALRQTFEEGYDGPVLVGCPSCKIGIGRCLINLGEKRQVLHVAEWLAGLIDGEDRRQSFRKRVNETRGELRVVEMSKLTGQKGQTC